MPFGSTFPYLRLNIMKIDYIDNSLEDNENEHLRTRSLKRTLILIPFCTFTKRDVF